MLPYQTDVRHPMAIRYKTGRIYTSKEQLSAEALGAGYYTKIALGTYEVLMYQQGNGLYVIRCIAYKPNVSTTEDNVICNLSQEYNDLPHARKALNLVLSDLLHYKGHRLRTTLVSRFLNNNIRANHSAKS